MKLGRHSANYVITDGVAGQIGSYDHYCKDLLHPRDVFPVAIFIVRCYVVRAQPGTPSSGGMNGSIKRTPCIAAIYDDLAVNGLLQ